MITKILLISNYPPDKQESMRRYAEGLSRDLSERGVPNEIWLPPVILGTYINNTHSGIGKYLGYFDKYVLAPIFLLLLRLKNLRSSVNYHICDHSNAPYRFYLPKAYTGITCHDVLAIRGALGYEDAYCPATGMGVLLQKWILSNLSKIPRIAAVSQFTLDQLLELATPQKSFNWAVVYNTFNAEFTPMNRAEARTLLEQFCIPHNEPFIFHIGSQLPRKNRKMLIEMFARSDRFKGKIVYAGQPIDPKLLAVIKEYKLEDQVLEIVKPNHNELVALYSLCHAFVFPSFSEGFGWPIIEAQACGAPVITSALDPMQEVGGQAALYANPNNPDDFASAIDRFQQTDLREEYIALGFQNIKRYGKEEIINHFLDLYKA